MRETCERFEILVSSWMDDELNRGDTVEMLDHLVRCHSCRSFYREGRALEGAVLSAGSVQLPDDSNASAGLWERIESEARPVERRPVRKQWLGGWALRAAALALVGLALAFVVAPRIELERAVPVITASSDEIKVELGSRRGEMTEERFLEITTEVLEADQRYQRAMLKVMDSVVEERAGTEGGGDELRADRRGEAPGERVGGRA